MTEEIKHAEVLKAIRDSENFYNTFEIEALNAAIKALEAERQEFKPRFSVHNDPRILEILNARTAGSKDPWHLLEAAISVIQQMAHNEEGANVIRERLFEARHLPEGPK